MGGGAEAAGGVRLGNLDSIYIPRTDTTPFYVKTNYDDRQQQQPQGQPTPSCRGSTEGEPDQPMVAVQSIMVAEQTQELATATTFATPDATTQRQGQVNEVRPDYSPYRTDHRERVTVCDLDKPI